MDTAKRVEKLRKKYERGLAASESRRAAYHQAVFGLIEQGGPGLRNFAEELGVLDQTVELVRPVERTLIANTPRRRRRGLARAAGSLAVVLVLVGMAVGGLRVARLPPFVSYVRVPTVMDMPEAAAAQRLRDAGLSVRTLHVRRSLPSRLFHRVLGVSDQANERVAKGSTIILYVAIPRKAAKKPHKLS